ncbi:MAG: prepilin-type N-terminal cleavage/methylation domain-containing protein [Deltaproteobacteria bacterium]|nr:MAG: prepilin-type N-terminal cleavage/methylation domain-containing protein [Deltaproteobacteria bacterium]
MQFRFHGAGAQDGFTLIEVLVAMTIFAIAILGLAIGATSVIRANQTSLYTTIATNLAQDRLEELKSRTAANITTTGSPENNISVSGVPVKFNRSWTVTSNCNSVSGLICVTVTVSWTDYISHNVVISSAVKQ